MADMKLGKRRKRRNRNDIYNSKNMSLGDSKSGRKGKGV
jgi:hypothetical protein